MAGVRRRKSATSVARVAPPASEEPKKKKELKEKKKEITKKKARRPVKQRVVGSKHLKKGLRTKRKARIVAPPPEHGRRTLAKQQTTPVAMSTLNVRRLLNDGVVEKKKEKKPERPRLWTSLPVDEEEEVDDKDPLEDHPDWTRCFRRFDKPSDHTSQSLLPHPLPLNYDDLEIERLTKKKEEKLEKQQEKWKSINWMDRKRQDHQTLPKYVRPALYLQYTKVLEEIDQMKKGNYPKDLEKEIKAVEEECKERAEESRRRQERKYQEKRAVLDKKHGTGTSQHSKILQSKKEELYAWMMEDVEERLRSIDTDPADAEPFWIEGPGSRKFLRSGRPAVASTPIDYVPGSDMDLNKKRKPNMQPLSYLLSESGIYRDLRRLGMLDALHSRSVSIYKAQIDNQKLTYEGRAYPRGQPLFIQTSAFAWFPVMILSMSEGWIQFRSSIPGDTRCVTATIEDLEAGRVLVSKFPRDANAPPPLPVSQYPPVITLQ